MLRNFRKYWIGVLSLLLISLSGFALEPNEILVSVDEVRPTQMEIGVAVCAPRLTAR